MESSVRHRLLLASAALLFSTGGAALKAATLTGWQVAGFRSLVAAVVLLAVLPGTRRGWNWRMAPVVLAYAATLVLFALANRLTTSANAIFLQATAPIYVLLLGPLILKERVHRDDIVFILCMGAGLGLFATGHDRAVATAPNPPLGNVLALGSGVAYAAMLTGLRWLSRQKQGDLALATVAEGNLAAFLIALPMALPVTHISAADAAVVLYLGAAQIGLAYWCLTRGISGVPAFEATTILQLEPAMNPVWTWLFHAERPNTWALAGGVVIVAATVVNTWVKSRRTAAKPLASA
ncbi:MAG: DMT family transporter [Acidobacteria bacterium]|nr:DMT family transporter [Acidobacteriota bacterium]